jgi:hypothetical protein
VKKTFTAPFISESAIVKHVIDFRQKYECGDVPVQIEAIIEQKLDIEIIPIPQLMKMCAVDAIITSDWKKILVDEEKYMDERYENRLRFSLAHEIGHFLLHKDLYATFGISSFSDFYTFRDKIDGQQYGFIEYHANCFASHLLIPTERLREEKEKLLAGKQIPAGIDEQMLNGAIAQPLSEVFGVSAEATERALNRKM